MNINPGKTEFTADEHAALRAEIAAITQTGLIQAEIAREADVPASSLSQYLAGSYPNEKGRTDIAAKLTRWIVSRRTGDALRSQAPIEPAFCPLKASAKVTGALAYAHAYGEMVLVGGVPGTSKTWACRQFAHDNHRTWFTSMDATTRGVPTMLLELLDAMGTTEMKGTPRDLMKAVCAKAAIGPGLIIVDEAQHLSEQALEALRAINDKIRARNGAGIGIALLGNELAQSRVASTGGQAAFAQVSSRFAKRVWLNAPMPEDAAALAQAWATANREEITKAEISFCQDIASRPGGLRNIEKTMKAAILAARGAEQPLTIDHLRWAYSALSGR